MPTTDLGLICDSAISENGQLFDAFCRSLHLLENRSRLRHGLRVGRIADCEVAALHSQHFAKAVNRRTDLRHQV